MKRSLALLALLAMATTTVALPAQASRRAPASIRKGGIPDLGLARPFRVPEHGARLTRKNAALSSVSTDGLSRALYSGRITAARFALSRVESAFDGDVEGADMSLLLSDLALRVRSLSGAARNRALDLLARPTDEGVADNPNAGYSYRGATTEVDCGEHFCIHWSEAGRHQIVPTDASGNSVPDYVDSVQAEMEHVWDVQIDELGFRPPKSDASSENDDVPAQHAAKLDVYLVDSGSDGIYGYCGTDDPNLVNPFTDYGYWDGSSYCGLDNDFRPAQFGGAPALESLRVTAAHEFFHAIQLAYSAGHDSWMSEGTAAMMEDVVYDEINDNYQYLVASSLRRPFLSLDRNQGPYHYGVWIFWRFLTELPPMAGAPDMGTDVIRETWEQAAYDGPNAPRLRSKFAVKAALADHNVSFTAAKSFFSVVNFVPEHFYEEGAAYRVALGGKRPSLLGSFTVGRGGTGTRVARLNHLTAGYVALKPAAGVSTLNVAVDLPAASSSPSARLITIGWGGETLEYAFSLEDGIHLLEDVPFARGSVQRAILVLDNASTRFSKCQQETPWTCGGPLDDGRQFAFAAAAR